MSLSKEAFFGVLQEGDVFCSGINFRINTGESYTINQSGLVSHVEKDIQMVDVEMFDGGEIRIDFSRTSVHTHRFFRIYPHPNDPESFFLVDLALAHMSFDEIMELRAKYYNLSLRVADFEKNYDLNGLGVYKSMPMEAVGPESTGCSSCNDSNGSHVYRIPMKRADLNRVLKEWGPEYIPDDYGNGEVCLSCGHAERDMADFECHCPRCLELRVADAEMVKNSKRALIQKEYSLENRASVNVDEYAVKEWVHLYVCLRALMTEDMQALMPYSQLAHDVLLAPRKEIGYEMLKQLYYNEFLSINPGSPESAFDLAGYSPESGLSFYLDRVEFVPNISITGHDERLGVAEAIDHLENLISDNLIEFRDDVVELWMEIATEECLDYLEALMDERDFKFERTEKVVHAIQKCLKALSQAQVYYFINLAARNASDTFQRVPGMPRSKAFQTIPNKMLNLLDRSIGENWLVKGYRRPYAQKLSMLSSILFDRFMKGADKAFNSPVGAESVFPDLSGSDDEFV